MRLDDHPLGYMAAANIARNDRTFPDGGDSLIGLTEASKVTTAGTMSNSRHAILHVLVFRDDRAERQEIQSRRGSLGDRFFTILKK